MLPMPVTSPLAKSTIERLGHETPTTNPFAQEATCLGNPLVQLSATNRFKS